LTPGPTPVPEETLLELAKPVIFHRTPEFRAILADVLADLQYVFQTKSPIIPLTSSGTGALEAAVANCLPLGSKAICLIVGGLGAMECRTDEWKIDVCCTGSQKALMMPPGLAFVCVSDKAWKVIDKNPNPRSFYFDLKKARSKLDQPDTPFTPAHTLIRAMRVSLKKIREEGIDKIWSRQARTAAAARAGFQALGLELFPTQPNTALTVVKMPPKIDSSK